MGSGHWFSLHFILSVSDPGQRVARTRLAPLGISHLRRRIFSPPPQVRLHSPHGPHSVQAESRRSLRLPLLVIQDNITLPNYRVTKQVSDLECVGGSTHDAQLLFPFCPISISLFLDSAYIQGDQALSSLFQTSRRHLCEFRFNIKTIY